VFDDSLMVFKIKVAVNWNPNLFLILSYNANDLVKVHILLYQNIL